jgi:hypothetical protein
LKEIFLRKTERNIKKHWFNNKSKFRKIYIVHIFFILI